MSDDNAFYVPYVWRDSHVRPSSQFIDDENNLPVFRDYFTAVIYCMCRNIRTCDKGLFPEGKQEFVSEIQSLLHDREKDTWEDEMEELHITIKQTAVDIMDMCLDVREAEVWALADIDTML
jgi:hypothetical protein